MTKLPIIALTLTITASAADPVRGIWILSPPSAAPNRPEVHSVEVTDRYVTVRSAGISLRYFGPLQQSPIPNPAAREFVFRIPRHPEPETGRHPLVPADITGVFANGLPIYNQFEALSYNGANLWHYDPIFHATATGLLEQLAAAPPSRPTLIGFALDGYPIYAAAGAHSSYRLRAITRRHIWPGGTALTPEQYGPNVTPDNPIGTFAEDYEYAPGSGDLDQFNGKFVVTSECPQGTYAYFLSAFPYLIGPRFYGRVPAGSEFTTIAKGRLTLQADKPLRAGTPIRFRLQAETFEYVHDRPIHLIVASVDLVEFDHIHPELTTPGNYEVTYTFAHGGSYSIWADYSLPGEPPHIDKFDMTVEGEPIAPYKTTLPSSLTVEIAAPQPLRANTDIPITFKLSGDTSTLEPYLGAWGHVIIISQDLATFTHAHPAETLSPATPIHTHTVTGPPPTEIHITTSFPAAGLYKLWAQFQQSGRVVTVPFVLHVGEAAATASTATKIPEGAIAIRITPQGYQPPTLDIPANQPLTLAFTRESQPNCGTEVIFPKLNIRQALPLGKTVLVQLPPQPAGELSFSCGMGMLRGMIVVGRPQF